MLCMPVEKPIAYSSRALGPELILVPRLRSVTYIIQATTFRQACGYLLSRRASPLFGQYKIILLGDRGRPTCVCEQLAQKRYL